MLKIIHIAAIILALGVTKQPFVTCWSLWPVRYWLKVENGLSKDVLDVHCVGGGKKTQDLGDHQVTVNDNFSWDFKTEVWKKVSYTCNLTCAKGHASYLAFEDDQSFVDKYCGGRHCTWKAADDGIYLYNDKKKRYNRLGTWDP